ncbi:MAG: HAD-IB family hydrolase [Gordonia sp. (in: high G+C Gram-positive bacteria)]
MTDVSPSPTAAFFDLDKTVIARSSALVFTRHFYAEGLLTKRGMLRSAVAQLQFALTSGDDHVEKLRAHVTGMCTGWSAQAVRTIVAEQLDDVVRPVIFPEALELIAAHKAAGRDVVLVSASGVEMVEPIGELLGVDLVRASVLEVADGHYTGEIDFYCYGDEKAAVLGRLAAERGYDLAGSYAYSDSSTDIPMLAAVGHAAVVNPDKVLRERATTEDWEILDFPNPAPMIEHPGRIAAATAATLALTAGVGVALAARRIHQKNSSRNT